MFLCSPVCALRCLTCLTTDVQVGIHYDGKFYEFVPWEGNVEWEITPWGSWSMSAQTNMYEVSCVSSQSIVVHINLCVSYPNSSPLKDQDTHCTIYTQNFSEPH